MHILDLMVDALAAALRDPSSLPDPAPDIVRVDLDEGPAAGAEAVLHPGFPALVVGTTADPGPLLHGAEAMCDLTLPAGSPLLARVADTIRDRPIAAGALARLLRGSEGRSLDDGLLAESATYSTLQAGPELAEWLAGRRARSRPAEGDPVRAERTGSTLVITLARPHVRNALNTAMRDRLVEVLHLLTHDPTIEVVHLRGEGAGFCSGGDLDEFGSFSDPASAHLVRLQQSVARLLAGHADKVTAHLHGACVGSGIELPAFAGRVVARPGTSVSLPEVGLGLVPGAGGTISLPARIGRHRTLRLALTGERLDAATALDWGLVDEISP
jgi:hypothetical protein